MTIYPIRGIKANARDGITVQTGEVEHIGARQPDFPPIFRARPRVIIQYVIVRNGCGDRHVDLFSCEILANTLSRMY